MTITGILSTLRAKGSRRNIDGMARYGIVSRKVFGVSAVPLQSIAKNIGRNHPLALRLWKTGWLEARMLAAFIADPAKVTPRQMNAWARDFDNWAITDGVCIHLFRKTPFGHAKAKEWSGRREEFVKRAGFTMMTTLAVHDKNQTDARFVRYLRLVERHALDERNGVKKSVNWALRQIGKRNSSLYKEAIRTALKLERRDSPAARWIASDALRELRSPKVMSRIRKSQ